MNYYCVSPYGVVGKDFEVLTYTYAKQLPIGSIVEIPVGKRKFIGVVLASVGKPEFECKEILRTLTDRPIPKSLLSLHRWISRYYTTHPGTVWQTILPTGLNRNRRKTTQKASLEQADFNQKRTNIVFTSDQSKAITKLLKMSSGTAILHGITGSGKTEVYKALAMEAATRKKSSIILVPEISLTAQLVSDFKQNFSHVIVTHSGQTESERHSVWLEAQNANEPIIVIGPRSALFMPLDNIGLIAIDECHEPSYKQEKAPRYNALRAASVLAEKTGSRLILGSATPLIADYYSAERLGRPVIEMKQLARNDAVKPKITVVDMAKRDARSNNRIFSKPLLDAMAKTIESKRQVLLFHNRRGTAPVTLCENCGWSAMCPRCFIPLTLHADKHQLRCHICGHNKTPPTSCPECQSVEILHKGIGTKMIEDEVRRLFPDADVKRFDGDSVKGEGVHDMFDDLRTGKVDVIIGTQTIAKGLDLPNLALVGIPQADAGLMLPDFSSSERVFQLIAQATGRVGRSKDPTEVIIQSFQPNHPAVIYGSQQDYKSFYDMEIENRVRGHFPPFSHLLKLTNSYKTEKAAIQNAKKLADEIHKDCDDSNTKILGPTPSFYERQRNNYHWQIVVRSSNRAELMRIAEKIPLTKWQVELDPVSLL